MTKINNILHNRKSKHSSLQKGGNRVFKFLHDLAIAIRKAIDGSGYSTGEIAGIMSEQLGRNISIMRVYNWCSTEKKNYTPRIDELICLISICEELGPADVILEPLDHLAKLVRKGEYLTIQYVKSRERQEAEAIKQTEFVEEFKELVKNPGIENMATFPPEEIENEK